MYHESWLLTVIDGDYNDEDGCKLWYIMILKYDG